MIDTHTHLYLPEFPDGGDGQVRNAIDAGVTHLVFPNVDRDTISPMLALHNRFPENTSVAMGLHPTEVKENWKVVVDDMHKLLVEGGFVAVGEVGMDLYWDKTYLKEQQIVLDKQVNWALEYDLPIVIHCRDAFDYIYKVLEPYKKTPLRGIFHSFTGTAEEATRVLEFSDFFIGINGVVTFKKSHLPEILAGIPLEKIVLETDSPYLTPVPNRGKRNESAYVKDTLMLSLIHISEPTRH